MATLTATSYSNAPRRVHIGDNSVTVRYNSGSTEISASATTVLLAKIPEGATITEIIEHHTCGAASCPVDIGIDDTLSAFISQGTKGTVNRLGVGANAAYQVDKSDDSVTQYGVLKATFTPGTGTSSVKLNLTVKYSMGD